MGHKKEEREGASEAAFGEDIRRKRGRCSSVKTVIQIVIQIAINDTAQSSYGPTKTKRLYCAI